jgi:protein-tyrosine phosphatase
VKTIIDMRSLDERERAPNRVPAHLALQQLSRPFLPRHTLGLFDGINSGKFDAPRAYDAMLMQYSALALDHTGDYRQIIDDLLEPAALPAILHCTSGKDRTGLIVAILLLAVGASTGEIIEDYVMTQDRIEKVDFFAATADPLAVEIVMAAKSDYIEAAFQAMRSEYGTIDGYISRGIGMTADKQRRLTQLLVEA